MNHDTQIITYKNGAKGLLVDVPGASVISLVAGFNAGFLFAPKELPELPHLMEHLVVGANSRFKTMKDFEAAVEANGAANNAFTSSYFLGYEMECAAFEFERILDLLAVEISTPRFVPREIEAEMGNVREELNRNLTNYPRVAYDALAAATLGRSSTEASLASLEETSRQAIVNYYRRTHNTKNLRFIFAGAIKPFRTLIEDFHLSLTNMDRGRRLAIPREKPMLLDVPALVKKDIPQLYYRFTQFGPPLPQKLEPALEILEILLTGRYKSWILGEARDRGLAYTVGSGADRGIHYSHYWVGAFTTPENSVELFKLIASKLKAAKQGKFSKEEMEEAKQLLVGRRLRQYKTPGHLLDWYAHEFFAHDRVDDFHRSLDDIRGLTLGDLRDACRRLFRRPLWGLSLVGSISERQAAELHSLLADIW